MPGGSAAPETMAAMVSSTWWRALSSTSGGSVVVAAAAACSAMRRVSPDPVVLARASTTPTSSQELNPRNSAHVEAAREVDHLAGDVAEIAARQRHDGVGDLGRRARPAQRDRLVGA